MTNRLMIAIGGVMIAACAAGVAHAETWSWDGKVRLGGIYLDQEGDRTTMQETFNLYDGFSVSSIYLNGYKTPKTHLLLDLTDINLDDRRGRFEFRQAGMFVLRSRYDESRFIYDPAGYVHTRRKDWHTSLSVTPSKWWSVGGDYEFQNHNGQRMNYNGGFPGWLGDTYDSDLHRWQIRAQATESGTGIGGAVTYNGVQLNDNVDPLRERTGYVVAADVHVPGLFFKRLTHVARGAIGRSELPNSDNLGYDLKSVQYTGLFDAARWVRLRYQVYGSMVDDEATTLRTTNVMQDVDATLRWRIAVLTGGYGWEALDDNKTVTTANTFRGSLSLREPKNRVSGRVSYAARDKDDQEQNTLLRDTEYDRLEARVDGRPTTDITVGARVADRNRKMPDIGTEAEGLIFTGYATWKGAPTGSEKDLTTTLGADYTYSDDDYDNIWGEEHIVTNAVTGRVGLTWHDQVDLNAAVTYLDMSEDLDIDKSILSFGAGYRFANGLSADAQYNIYNFDDYLVASRYYTANVVWFNVGYAFSKGSQQQ